MCECLEGPARHTFEGSQPLRNLSNSHSRALVCVAQTMTTREHSPYENAVEFLYRLQWFGAKLGLENTRRLAMLAGNPERRLRFIHVAGTNGKGSTCAMLESIYRAAGYKTGLFTSPHLVSFRERIQINRTWITEGDVVRIVEQMKGLLEVFPQDDHPTFFETVTVMALRYFAEKECDLVIWETGLGGRLDATNIVTPEASVITNVQLDHQKWLGETVDKIAAEKAGIIKPGVPVITGAHQPEVLEVIRSTASTAVARLEVVSDPERILAEFGQLEIGLPGAHQKQNAAVALATVRALEARYPVPREAIWRGIATVDWPGRMQTIVAPSGQTFILDGAHNPAGAEALVRSVRESWPGKRLAFVMGILQDKAWEEVCRTLAPAAASIVLVPVQNERTATPGMLAPVCQSANPAAQVRSCDSLSDGLRLVEDEGFVVITGSLYLIGEAIEQLGGFSRTVASERGLNEWTLKQ